MTGPLRPLIAALLAAAALWAAFMGNPTVAGAERATARIAVVAGGVYVSLRIINATLSVAQEIEVGGSAVVSASAQPIKVLDPVDDTVERVAAAVFAVSVVAATLSVGLEPLSLLGVGLMLGALLPWLVLRNGAAARLSQRALIAGAALAFVLPALFWTGAGLADTLTAPRMATARAELSAIADRARGISAAVEESAAEEEGSMFDWLSGGMGEIADSVRAYRDSVAYFLTEADTILAASLTVIGLLLLQTVLLPLTVVLLALWILSPRRD